MKPNPMIDLVYHDHSIINYQRKYGIELNTFPKLLGVLVNIRELTVNDAQGITHLMNHNISLLAALPVMNNRLSDYS